MNRSPLCMTSQNTMLMTAQAMPSTATRHRRSAESADASMAKRVGAMSKSRVTPKAVSAAVRQGTRPE